MYTYHSLEAKNKLINAKSNREPGMERAGENQAWGSCLQVQPLSHSSREYFFVGQFKLSVK